MVNKCWEIVIDTPKSFDRNVLSVKRGVPVVSRMIDKVDSILWIAQIFFVMQDMLIFNESVDRTSKLSLVVNILLNLSHVAEVPQALANMVYESSQPPDQQSADHDSKHNVDLCKKQGRLGIVNQVSEILSFEISGQVNESCSSLLERVEAAVQSTGLDVVQMLLDSDEEVVSLPAEYHRKYDPITSLGGSMSCAVCRDSRCKLAARSVENFDFV